MYVCVVRATITVFIFSFWSLHRTIILASHATRLRKRSSPAKELGRIRATRARPHGSYNATSVRPRVHVEVHGRAPRHVMVRHVIHELSVSFKLDVSPVQFVVGAESVFGLRAVRTRYSSPLQLSEELPDQVEEGNVICTFELTRRLPVHDEFTRQLPVHVERHKTFARHVLRSFKEIPPIAWRALRRRSIQIWHMPRQMLELRRRNLKRWGRHRRILNIAPRRGGGIDPRSLNIAPRRGWGIGARSGCGIGARSG